MLRSILLPALLLLFVLTGCASDDGAQTRKEGEAWRTASQRVPEQSRRPSPRELEKQAKARELMADEGESDSESTKTESTKTESAADSAVSNKIPDEPIRLDPEGPVDRETYVRPAEVTEGLEGPVKVYDPQPKYLDEAREAGIEGTVVFDLYVDETGTVRGADLFKGLPMGLTLEVYKAVKTWRFEPATLNGEPIRIVYRLTVSFGGSRRSQESDDP